MAIVFPLLVLAAMVFAVVDIIVRDDALIRFMPKALWLLLVILIPLLGTILWFVLGREYPENSAPAARMARMPRMPRMPRATRTVEPVRPPVARPRDTRTTEQQLADLEREIEEERLRAQLRERQQRRAEGPDQASRDQSAE